MWMKISSLYSAMCRWSIGWCLLVNEKYRRRSQSFHSTPELGLNESVLLCRCVCLSILSLLKKIFKYMMATTLNTGSYLFCLQCFLLFVTFPHAFNVYVTNNKLSQQFSLPYIFFLVNTENPNIPNTYFSIKTNSLSMEEKEKTTRELYWIQSFEYCFYTGKIKREQSKTGIYVLCSTHRTKAKREKKMHTQHTFLLLYYVTIQS